MNLDAAAGRDGADESGLDCTTPHVFDSDPSSASTVNHVQQVQQVLQTTPPNSQPSVPVASCKDDIQNIIPSGAVTLKATSTNPSKKRADREAHLAEVLRPFDRSIQYAVRSWLAVPYDSLRLRNFELQVEVEPGLRSSQRDTLKALVRVYGRKEKKRPRDRLLRDPLTKKVVLEERKKTAFLGYDWRRGQTPIVKTMMTAPGPARSLGGAAPASLPPPPGLQTSATTGIGSVNRPEVFCQGGGG